MVVDDHPMWRDAVERDLQAAGFDVVAVAADGHRGAGPVPGRAARRSSCSTCRSPAPNGVEVTAEVLAAGPVGAGADPVGVRRAGRRARGGQGRGDRLPREVGVARGAARRRTPGGRRATPSSRPGWPGWCWGSSAGSPTARADPSPTRRSSPSARPRCCEMVAKGMSYKQIAERLVLSHRTVQNHVQNTLRKLQMHNRVRADPLRHRAGPRRGRARADEGSFLPHGHRRRRGRAARPRAVAPTSSPSRMCSTLASSRSPRQAVLDRWRARAGRAVRHRGRGRRATRTGRLRGVRPRPPCGTWRCTHERWGRGVGSTAVDRAVTRIRAGGVVPRLWCLVDNHRPWRSTDGSAGRPPAPSGRPSGRRTRPRSRCVLPGSGP